MSHNTAVWTHLGATFELDLPITHQLLTLLQTERQALESRDYSTFQAVVGKKQQLLQTLEQHALQRQELLRKAGFQNEQSTLQAADQEAPPVAKHWRLLRDQWQQCQELNEINERIAKRTRLVVGQILDLMRGTTGNNRLYDNKGAAKSTGGGNTITSA